MRYSLAFLGLVTVVATSPAAGADKDRLRSLLKLPQLTYTMLSVNSATDDVFGEAESSSDPADEIEAIQEAMEGNSADADRYLRLGKLYSEQEERDRSNAAYAKAADLFALMTEDEPTNGAEARRESRSCVIVAEVERHRYAPNSEVWWDVGPRGSEFGRDNAGTTAKV